ncbi:C4-dicarboxylate ABC transporter [Thermococcus chitonophagus]|uniref:C4-dicarboxylate ABC transporter n=1 Tax=Thermococcus chitonophagus TaxID=54262 RepID=A0A2Z2N5E0_9EURY|nr:C4-dicarboxylate ABC transporter [Thermococcus chitonophagus]ASJ17285.1 C4-dicarboxylate ABC transporter [Thermococcus chitonophagus]
MKWIKEFPPSWFASVMGTGALAITSKMLSQDYPLLLKVAKMLAYLNTFLFIVLLIPWILRWLLYREDALRDLYHPVVSHFYGTIAIVWLIGVAMTIGFSLLIPYVMFTQGEIDTKTLGPAWFIPPVGLIVIPMTCFYKVDPALLYFSWGSGFFLYLALFSMVMLRFIRHEPMPCGLAPSIWINLGPIGAGASSYLAIVKGELSFLVVFLWGFGIWWFLMAVMLTLYYIRKISLPYSLAWWAFIFPLGAYTSATLKVASLLNSSTIKGFGVFLYAMLFVLWLLTGGRTVIHVVRR